MRRAVSTCRTGAVWAARFVVLWVAAAAMPAFADEPESAGAAESDAQAIQNVVYFAPRRPMFVRFHIRVDGGGFLERRDRILDDMLKALDASGDGSLDAEESVHMPTVAQLSRSDQPVSPAVAMAEPDADGDGTTTRAEFRQYVARAAGPAFEIVAEPPRNRVRTDLFARLDSDSDGALAQGEWAIDQPVLVLADANDDELLSATELNPIGGSVEVAEETAVRSLTALLMVLDRVSPSEAVIRRLLVTYDKFSRDPESGFFAKNGLLSASELGLEPAALAGADRDGDQQLGVAELREFLKNPPADVELAADLHVAEGKPAEVRIVSAPAEADAQAIAARQTAPGRVNFAIGGLQAELDPIVERPASTDLAGQYTQLFQAFDGDNNDYLDPTEFNNLGGSFAAVDADGDRKVFLEELLKYIALQSQLAQARMALVVSNQSKTLFDLLDNDADGRLSRRELNRAPDRLSAWDADGNGKVAIAEIPGNYRMQFSVGRPVTLGSRVPQPPQPIGSEPLVRRTSGPLWFQRMDRNGDGDVSRREFLGPLEIFRALDADSDGLVDANEAAAERF